jgi:aspartate aminotransferase
MLPALRRELPARPSILALAAECRRQQACGRRVIDLSVGEPAGPTPEHVVQAACRAASEGRTRYGPSEGLSALRVAARRRLVADGAAYGPREVMVTCGATGALSCAFRALLEPGDEVLIPAPYYPAYIAQIAQAGGCARIVRTDASAGYKVDVDALRAAVTPRTRLLVLNTPSNPAGVVYARSELAAIADVAVSADLLIVADEVYRDFMFADPAPPSIAALDAEVRARTLVVRSLSKSYAMTGWRVGIAAGPQALIGRMTAVQEASILAPSTVSQWAAVAAIDGPQDFVARLRREIQGGAARLVARLAAIDGIDLVAPAGGFFVFARIAGVSDVASWCADWLAREAVAVIPGAMFGEPSAIRISAAAASEDIDEGLTRLEHGLGRARCMNT